MATQGGLPDDLLANLAGDIETGEQMESLGRALGFKSAAINRYTETNRLEGRVTCKGTRDMLFDWRQTMEPSNQHLRLKEALINAKLVMLADTHFKETTGIQDIYSQKISGSLTIGQCREKLANKYLSKLCKIQMKPWDPDDYAEFEDMHTVVTMVKKDAQGRETKKKEILQGSVDKIFSTKINGKLPTRILISAPAGRGKTTAVAKMAYDWAQKVKGSALEHLPLLFVLKLRSAGQLTSIGEAIKSQLLSDVIDLTPEVMEHFIRENQGICHILLDGLDEYAGITSSKQSLGSNIVDVMLWKEFPECRVLVTTRPHLENFFNRENVSRVYSKMWIEGFSRDNSREYIDKFFASSSNPSNGHGLKDYLDTQPLINELVLTPLFCLMVCHLWSESLLGSHTKTQTDLLDSVNVFLMHHANARSKSNYKITHDELSKIICKLGKVALAGLLDDANKLIFTPYDFRNDNVILERAYELGILFKTTTQLTGLPQSHVTSCTTTEFYHKLAQEHSAGKYLADETNKYLLWLKISKLDRVLRKIRAHIGDYENLIRFAAGTENNLCIRIMEALLANSSLDESERYRILLDCSSETTGTDGSVSSLVQKCVTAERIVLKSPTVYTVVGMQNLPQQLKVRIQEVKFEDSTIYADVTSGLWSCLNSFPDLHTLTITDSTLNFPSSPPELPSVKKLKAERVTSQSYESLLSSCSSLPSLQEIDATMNDVEGHTSQITASSPIGQTGDQQLAVHIKLQSTCSLSREKEIDTGTAELSLLIGEHTDKCQWIRVTGLRGRGEEAMVNLFDMSTHLKSLNVRSGCDPLNSDRQAINISSLTIRACKLTALITSSMWSCLRSFPSLGSLTISDSSLSFPSSPPELTSVTKLEAKRVTSQSYEGLLSSIPNVKEIDITVGSAENEDISQIRTSLGRHLTGQELTLIRVDEPHSLPSEESVYSLPSEESVYSLSSEKSVSGMSREMRGLGLHINDEPSCTYHGQKELTLLGVVCGPGETVIDLVKGSARVMSSILYSKQFSESMDLNRKALNIGSLTMKDCKLTATVTSSMWSCLRSFPSLDSLTISDSSLSFPPSPPELKSVTRLEAEKLTSQSYEGLLSSLPGLKKIDITINDADGDISQITAGLRRTGGQQLTDMRIEAPAPLLSEKKNVSRETMRGLDLLIREQTKNLKSFSVSGVKCTDDDYVDLIESSTILPYLHFQFLGWGSLDYKRNTDKNPTVTLGQCQLSTEMTIRLWTCLRSLPSLGSLTISDSSLSFPPSPPKLTSVTMLIAKRVTSQSYEGLLSSIPNVNDITLCNAEEEDISQIQTSLGRHLTGQELTLIRLDEPHSLPSEESVSGMSRETMRGLGLHINDVPYYDYYEPTLLGVVCGPGETVIDLVQGSSRVMSSILYSKQVSESLNSNRETINNRSLTMRDCKLSATVTSSMWSCLRSFPLLITLTISDSSLSFPPSPPELTSITELEAKRVTSQSYEGLLSSLPDLKVINITMNDAERDISQITAGLRRTGGQQLRQIDLQASDSLPPEKKNLSRETMKGLSLLIREHIKNLQSLSVSGVKCMDEDFVDLIESSKILPSLHFQFLGWGSLDYRKDTYSGPTVTLDDCQLSTEMAVMLWTCLKSFTSLKKLTISDSSLSFPPSPPELTSITRLEAERVTSQSYEGLLSSLPGLETIKISMNDAERDISQITACLRRTGGQQLTHFFLVAQDSLPQEKKTLSRETMRGLSLLIREHTKKLESLSVSGVKCMDEDYVDLIEHVQCLKILRTLHFQFRGWGSLDYKRNTYSGPTVTLGDCQLSTEMTIMLWTCLRSFTSLSSLIISDSSLSFPPSPPEITSVTRLIAKRVTSQSYEGLLSSLPGLKGFDIIIDDAEGDISQITACLCQTGGQQLTYIILQAQDSLPQEKEILSRETMRGLGLLIRKQTKNLQDLVLSRVRCTDEEDLVYLIECCRHVKAMEYVELFLCGTKEGGRLDSHLKHHSSVYGLTVLVQHDYHGKPDRYNIPHIR